MEGLRLNKNRIISVKQAKILSIIITIAVSFNFLFFPIPTLADIKAQDVIAKESLIDAVFEENKDSETESISSDAGDIKISYTFPTTLTAYNSEVGQCDDTPCITANGFDVCEHGIEDTVATNGLKFGTRIRIPELFGDRIFIVRDRMNKRYTDRVDVWMIRKIDAKTFGKQYATIEVLE